MASESSELTKETAARRQKHYRFWLGIGISLVFMFLAIRQADWADVFATLVQGNFALLTLGSLLGIGTYVIFSARWQVLLSSTRRISFLDSFCFIMVGYLASIILPLRLGDMARAVLLSHRRQISASSVLGSIVLERVLDVLTVLLMATGLSLLIDIPPIVRISMMTFAVGALAAMGGLLVLALCESRLPTWAARFPTWVPHAFVNRLIGVAMRFSSGLLILRHGRQLLLALLLSGVAWAIAGMGTVCYVKAFDLPVPWYAGFFLLAVVNLGSAIPSSPGFIGVYHYLVVLALSVWLPDKNVALAYAIATHGLNIVVNLVLGSMCLWLVSLEAGVRPRHVITAWLERDA